MSMILARGLAVSGHEVVVVTFSDGEDHPEWAFDVLRNPGRAALWRVVKDSDVVVHNNILLRAALPVLLLRKPWVVAVHTWLRRTRSGRAAFQDHLKQIALRRASVISVSEAIAAHLKVDSVVVPNSYRDDVFVKTSSGTAPLTRLSFVGRLVSDKGVDVLIRAIADLRSRGFPVDLVIVGGGPERASLEAQAQDSQLSEHVRFTGELELAQIATIIRERGVLVVPSRWEEPFGVVALEGIGSGCIVVGTNRGGLPDAIGPCGITIPPGNSAALSDAVVTLLTDDELVARIRQQVDAHLSRHTPAAMVHAYEQVIRQAMSRASGKTAP